MTNYVKLCKTNIDRLNSFKKKSTKLEKKFISKIS